MLDCHTSWLGTNCTTSVCSVFSLLKSRSYYVDLIGQVLVIKLDTVSFKLFNMTQNKDYILYCEYTHTLIFQNNT